MKVRVAAAWNPMPTTRKTLGKNGTGDIFDKLIQQLGNPAEFRLPKRFNKWKPAPYKFIKRNLYLTKRVKKRHEDDGIFCSCNSSPGSNAVCGRDCHCGMLLSSCSSGCNCGSACVNKPFHHRHTKKMLLVQTEKCGSGVVADEDIKQGEYIIEYVGEVIDDKTCEERLWKMKHRGETNFYLCEINRDMVIDATYKGNMSRYINHSCSPNTEMQKWSIDGETRIGIFAIHDIKKGDHLTYDYKFVQFGADQDCHCGAVGCRRKLGVNLNKPKTPSSDATLRFVVSQNGELLPDQRAFSRNCIGELVLIHSSANRTLDTRSFGLIKQYDSVNKKHLILFEDGVTSAIDMTSVEWEFVPY